MAKHNKTPGSSEYKSSSNSTEADKKFKDLLYKYQEKNDFWAFEVIIIGLILLTGITFFFYLNNWNNKIPFIIIITSMLILIIKMNDIFLKRKNKLIEIEKYNSDIKSDFQDFYLALKDLNDKINNFNQSKLQVSETQNKYYSSIFIHIKKLKEEFEKKGLNTKKKIDKKNLK